ncbi:DNA-binding transcriptional LysR family regulator [Nonomuraea polychroma]|uniref:DNA-binding transcriptional LysR family regulator n=1 Tax=Nonomuraea polychroma TaxID=46176 RepID=A0A438M787_9ACTN|nr:LysR family transcriptional regulator [Nonomuraea polychroma]RVX41572.1 DNA-binding transcriptional LysR family regulator [Nonomuraea polychroma]
MPLPPETPDLDVLDLLVAVAETGSLGQAAQRHGISQPAASMRISTLERRLRLVLLERGPTGSRLTTAGAAVVTWALPVLDAARALVDGVTALHAEGTGRLRVAASMTIADHRVPGWLVALRARSPDVRVALQVGNSEHVAALVQGGSADLGFVEGPGVPRGLRSRVVESDELVAVVAPGHPWARRRGRLSMATLAGTPLIMREPGSGTRDAVWGVLSRVREPAPPAAELGSTAAIKAAVAAGEAPTVLSRLVVRGELEDGRLVAVPLDAEPALLRRWFRAVWRPEAPPSGAGAALLAIAVRR